MKYIDLKLFLVKLTIDESSKIVYENLIDKVNNDDERAYHLFQINFLTCRMEIHYELSF